MWSHEAVRCHLGHAREVPLADVGDRVLVGTDLASEPRFGLEQDVFKDNGDVPLFGHKTQLRVLVDPDLLRYDPVRDIS